MKKIIYILFVSLLISSCTSQIEYRIPAFQATINVGLDESSFLFDGFDPLDSIIDLTQNSNNWEATNFNVTTNALGEGIITGNDFNSAISLRFPSINIGVYDLRENIIGEATYQDTIQYSTLNDGIGSIAYFSDGEISINEITSDSKISGTFTFNAYNSSGATVNVSNGIFYRLPLIQTTD